MTFNLKYEPNSLGKKTTTMLVFCSSGVEYDGANCHSDAFCTSQPKTFNCASKHGWNGDKVTCTKDDPCTKRTGNCHVNATIETRTNLFRCARNCDYSGDGV